MRSDLRVRELTNTLDAINQISGDMMWNSSTLSIENSSSRLRQTEQLLGRASSIHTLSSKYAQGLSKSKQGGAELNMWSNEALFGPLQCYGMWSDILKQEKYGWQRRI
jgi:hypothetical protein